MWKKISLGLALLAAASFAFAQTPQRSPAPQGPPPQQARVIEICKGTTPPAGFVITAERFSPNCREAQTENTPKPNAWAVKRPSRREVVCAESKYPENYAATGRVTARECPGGSQANDPINALLIEQVD